jgi:hypothetical protein
MATMGLFSCRDGVMMGLHSSQVQLMPTLIHAVTLSQLGCMHDQLERTDM